jgi:hypothetical protein
MNNTDYLLAEGAILLFAAGCLTAFLRIRQWLNNRTYDDVMIRGKP